MAARLLRHSGHVCTAAVFMKTSWCSDEIDLAAVRRAIERRQVPGKWSPLDRELSSDIAGETGAVWIYRGAAQALALRGDHDVGDFVASHEAAERKHLAFFVALLDPSKHTCLLPVWRGAGYALGFLPTLLAGPHGLFATVESVETFVVDHYTSQLQDVVHGNDPDTLELIRLLELCCADERHHMLDARQRRLNSSAELSHDLAPDLRLIVWDRIVRTGSAAAAETARRI